MSLIITLGGTELIFRSVDGWQIRSLRLQQRFRPGDRDEVLARKHAAALPLADGIELGWFDQNPAPLPARPTDPTLEERYRTHPGQELNAVYEWNAEFLRFASCQEPWKSGFTTLTDLYAFDSTDGGMFPTFRFPRGVRIGSGLSTNDFGWRGPNIQLEKPSKRFRMAFVGASTTVGGHGYPFSYPEFIGHWLNLWAAKSGLDIRFDIINAGREGINSDSTSAIVRQELVPVEPDLVVYYEGANHFWPSNFIDWPGGVVPQRPNPPLKAHERWRVSRYSALASRLNVLGDSLGGAQSEPGKPVLAVHWPGSLDEHDPDLHHPDLPLYLPTILKNFDSIRDDLAPIKSRLVIASFVWLVSDGLKLDRVRHDGLFRYLNGTFWPYTYHHLRRMLDFQNRVFAKYALANGLDFLDVAREYPQDPDMFLDAIHTTPAGIRLQAWVVLQSLVPVVAKRIAAGELAKATLKHYDKHPAFASPRHTVLTRNVMEECEFRLRRKVAPE